MDRVRGIALLVIGCAAAAAAAATGPYLGETQNLGLLNRLTRDFGGEEQVFRRSSAGPVDDWFRLYVEVAMAALFVLAVLYGLFHLVRGLVRLARLRLGLSVGGRAAADYDPGEESHEDAETPLRRRVRDELAALSTSLDDAADAREVVIACYARMERAFDEAGAGRRPTESPMELLVRVLGDLAVPGEDVRRLTALFTEARFSTHPVTDEMRAAAQRSLRNVADALAVPA